MVIGIDAHELEGKRTGVGRYLFNILRVWEQNEALRQNRIVLFFKDAVPEDIPPGFDTRLLRSPFQPSSKALFMHVLLLFAARRERVDVLFCPGYVGPLFWTKPLVLTLHDIVYEAQPKLFNWRGPQDKLLLKFVSKRVAHRAKRILVPSRFTASEVGRLYHIPQERIVITPLAAEPAFRPHPDKTQARAVALRYGATGPYLFFVGSIFSRRHIPECIAAFMKIAQNFPRHQFLIAGANVTRPHIALETLMANANVQIRRRALVWAPYIASTDLPSLYTAAEGTVWISEYEGFGLPPLESMACGTPVITTNRSALAETVGDCAFLVDNPKDPNDIANAMRTLLENPSLRQRLSTCGIQHASQFSWGTCAATTLKTLYEAVTE